MSTFNTEPLEEVQQEDPPVYGTPPVPVCIPDRVLTEALPTILGPCKNYMIGPGADPVQILDENPRRARATIMVQNQDVCVGGTIGEARGYVGAIVSGSLSVPFHTNIQSAFWARGVLLDFTGTVIGFNPSTDTALVSVIEEFYTR